jgi:xylitol oxidase
MSSRDGSAALEAFQRRSGADSLVRGVRSFRSKNVPANQRNWAGNFQYGTDRVHRPQTIEQLSQIVKQHRNLKVLATRHSFNRIADSADAFVSLEHLDRVVHLDRQQRTVTIEGGMKYGQLGEYLHQQGYALGNLASLPHISVAGACATATHGSGEKNGNLATAVGAMEIVTAGGEIVEISRAKTGEAFGGMVVHLGGLGIVTKLTLDIFPTFLVRQDVYQNLPFDKLEENLDAIQASAYSVSLFTDWQSDSINQIWLKCTVTGGSPSKAAPTFFDATLAATDLHPIAGISAENCTLQSGVPGPWHERLPHFRMGYTPSSGEELQAEYFIARKHAVAAIRTIRRLHKELAPLLFISELRTIAADTLWMSPCYRQPSLSIHFTWRQNQPAVEELLRKIEAKLEPFNPRPHWGKLFEMSPRRLRSRYERIGDFRQMLQSYDQSGKFRNAFLNRYIFAPQGAD